MESERGPGSWWPRIVLFAVLLLGAFAVPIGGMLRDSTARIVIAAGIVVVGVGLSLLLVAQAGGDKRQSS